MGMSRQFVYIVLVLVSACLGGCVHVRSSAAVDVPDVGARVVTKYRYCYVGELGVNAYNEKLRMCQPGVFSDDGVPFMMRKNDLARAVYGQSEAAHLGQFLLCMCSAGMLPFCNGSRESRSVSIEFPDWLSKHHSGFGVCTRRDEALSLFSPFALLCFNGTPSFPGFPAEDGKIFQRNAGGIGAQGGGQSEDAAIAYGIAYRLQEMERMGIITDAMVATAQAKRDADLRRQKIEAQDQRLAMEQHVERRSIAKTLQEGSSSQSGKPPYHIDYLRRDSEREFAYEFELVLNGEPSLQTFSAVQNVLANEIRSAYRQEHPGVDLYSLQIAFYPELVNGKIKGRAEVLTITLVSLTYDAYTRHGKMAARFNANQYEEARKWIRKNIETLARDKNIALVTGEIPPAAKFYLGREELKDGNVLEIEFKTE